jgi:hypothetical protein
MVRVYVPVELARRVRESARDRCGYCLSPQHLILGGLQVEHLIPRSRGGPTEETNLWLSCSVCNNYKGDRTSAADPATGESCPLFNPRTQRWSEHFRWSEDGLRIVGLTPVGRATVEALHLADDPSALTVRSYWVRAGWHPPAD